MGTRGQSSPSDEYSIIAEDKEDVGFLDIGNYQCEVDEDEPVIISSPFPFVNDKPQSIPIGEVSKCPITITNITDEPVEIWGIRIFCSNPKDSFKLSIMEPPSAFSDEREIRDFLESDSLEDRTIQPNQTLKVWLNCKPKDLGMHQSLVHFDANQFRIERAAFVLAEDNISQSLASRRSYSRNPRRRHFAIDECVAAVRPSRPKTTQRSNKAKLPEYPIPKNIRELIANKKIPWPLDEGLTVENYSSYFSTLLIMEELHLEVKFNY